MIDKFIIYFEFKLKKNKIVYLTFYLFAICPHQEILNTEMSA